jgi:hypothetical protein
MSPDINKADVTGLAFGTTYSRRQSVTHGA